MKIKPLSVVAVFITAILLMSFSMKNQEETRMSERANLQNWGPWKTASCFRYLKYRVKKKSYENEWGIEFQNGYNKSISMSVNIVDGYGGDRFTIPSGESRVRSGYYTNNRQATYINFEVNKVKFGDTSWGGPYANCDY